MPQGIEYILKNKSIDRLNEDQVDEIRAQFGELAPNYMHDGQTYSKYRDTATGKERWVTHFWPRGIPRKKVKFEKPVVVSQDIESGTPTQQSTIAVVSEVENEVIESTSKIRQHLTLGGSRPMKLWNGPFNMYGSKYGRNPSIYIAAKTKNDAATILLHCYGIEYSDSEMKRMWAEIHKRFSEGSWGIRMNGITPTSPCAYVIENTLPDSNPIKIYDSEEDN